MKIAVVGAGIAGLASAHRLSAAGHEVALFEAGDYFGGHAHTVDVTLNGVTHGVDTGFLVYNERTYPLLTSLFETLPVRTAASDMSFSVRTVVAGRPLEWAGTNLAKVFAQPRNLLRPEFLRMLADILRFNRHATQLARNVAGADDEQSLRAFLAAGGYGRPFREWYLLPMAGCIWSCPTELMLEFPVATFARFCDNHGLLQILGRPQWRTVAGGSRHYVSRLLAGIERLHINTPVTAITRQRGAVLLRYAGRDTEERFDHAVVAVHSDQALHMLQDADAAERELLGAIRYQPNRAVLHTDSSCLPRLRRAWAAWNYQSGGNDTTRVCVHYLLNRLQPLPFSTPVIVSLNPVDAPQQSAVLAEYDYAHPVFDGAAIAAQRRLPEIQGPRNVWFAGAWTGYGFHEDGLRSGLDAAAAILHRCAEILPVAA